MADIPNNDETRLQATEAQMRRALGLQKTTPVQPTPAPPTGPHRPARRFVRDGEVPVSVVHCDEVSAAHPLDAARQALRAQTGAREQAERYLAEARTTIRDLQTKLAHERLAKDEAIQRIATEKQAGDQALHEVRAELSAVRAAAQEVQRRLQELMALQHAAGVREPRQVSARRKEGTGESVEADTAGVAVPAPAKRRGRPPKVRQLEPESEIVEWWKPGWRDCYR